MRKRQDMEDLSVKEIMDRWPATIGVFIGAGLHCVGCPIGPFHTIADAAAEHRLAAADLTAAILARLDLEQSR